MEMNAEQCSIEAAEERYPAPVYLRPCSPASRFKTETVQFSTFSSFCWASLDVHGQHFHTYRGGNFPNRQTTAAPQLSAYKRTFQRRDVRQLLWNTPLSQNRWICSGSDYSFFELSCILVASHAVCGTQEVSEESERLSGLKLTSESHTLLEAWDSPILVLVLLLCCEMWGKCEVWLFGHIYMLYAPPTCPPYPPTHTVNMNIFFFPLRKRADLIILHGI